MTMVASLAVLVDPCDQPPPDGATSNQSKEFVKTPGLDTIEHYKKLRWICSSCLINSSKKFNKLNYKITMKALRLGSVAFSLVARVDPCDQLQTSLDMRVKGWSLW